MADPDDRRRANPRGTDNRLGAGAGRQRYRPETNRAPRVSISADRDHYEFTGANIESTSFAEPAFQNGLDDLANQYKALRAQGRQPEVTITGLASSSVRKGKGASYYADARAEDISKELQKRGVSKHFINVEGRYGPEQDPRSISPQDKALNRGASVSVKRPSPTDGFYDERTLGKTPGVSGTVASFLEMVGPEFRYELGAAGRGRSLSFYDMRDDRPIGRLAIEFSQVANPFFSEHENKLKKVGLSTTNSNAFNGSIKNAFRHSAWQALGTHYIGLEQSAAAARYKDRVDLPPNIKENQSFRSTKAESGDSVLYRADTVIDLLNNRIGQSVALANKNASAPALCEAILTEAYANGLWIADTIENLGTAQQPDFEVTIRKRRLTQTELSDLTMKTRELFRRPGVSETAKYLEYELRRPPR